MKITDLCGKHTVSFPGNGISSTGIDLIQHKLNVEWNIGLITTTRPLPPSKEEYWQWEWKIGGKGEYVGALPKRIAKLIYQCKGVKLTPEQLSEIGNIGSAHSGRHETYWFDVVNEIEWENGDFGDGGSCFWSCHASAKDMLVKNGAGAIRFFKSDSYHDGFARAWIVPWKGCWLVFNGYGMETLPIARVLSVHLDHAYYHKAYLCNNGERDGELYINGGCCYVVGPQEVVLEVCSSKDSIDLEWVSSVVFCNNCEDSVDSDEACRDLNGDILCESCHEDICSFCAECDTLTWRDSTREDPDGSLVCEDCFENKYFKCQCGVVCSFDDSGTGPDDELYCENCWCNLFTTCDGCGDVSKLDEVVSLNDELFCNSCHAKVVEEEEEAETCTNG